MIAPICTHDNSAKHGKDRKGNQRFKCKDCGKTYLEERNKPLGSMQIDIEQAIMALKMLLEGMSIRAVARITDIHQDTISKLILTVGSNCESFLKRAVRDVACERIEMDEIWSFVGMKQKRASAMAKGPDFGDSWTFIAVDADTKLVVSHYVGHRTNTDTDCFLQQVAESVDTTREIQVTTDGFGGYQYGVPLAMGSRVQFAQLVKQYKSQQEQTRYSPAQIIGAKKVVRFGNPDLDNVSTSYVESLNQKFRMHVRRFTRLTNAHSKSLKHHKAMQAIWFAFYNFARKHDTLKTSPAVAAGLATDVWSVRELIEAVA